MSQLLDSITRRVAGTAFGMPESAAEKVFGPPPTNDRGTPLDHQFHVLLSLQRLLGQAELHERGVEGARDYFRQVTRVFDRPGPGLAQVRDRRIDGPDGPIDLRIYRPRLGEQLPACVFYHGGGFVIGGLETYDGLCRTLASRGACTVVSVDYRLAPEAPFPAAIDDALAAFRWTRGHAEALGIDRTRMAVAGDSAGGNIATVVAQRQVADGEAPPDLQLLIYPKTDQGEGGEEGYPSREHFAEDFYLTWSMAEWFAAHYLSAADVAPAADPRVSPIRFDRLGELPPAVVVTAGFDPLRDEGRAYAERLDAAGVSVVHRRFERLVHGFVTTTGVIDAAARATADVAELFRAELHRL